VAQFESRSGIRGVAIRSQELRGAVLRKFGAAKAFQENKLSHDIAIVKRRYVDDGALFFEFASNAIERFVSQFVG
jgi:hypothetical protein